MKLLLLVLCLIPLALSKIQCPGSANCSCSNGVNGDFEILCPENISVHPTVVTSFQPKKYIKIQCTKANSWKELELMSGLNLGPVQFFVLRLCPLPGISFKELMITMGIPSTNSLQFQSFGNISNTLTKAHLEGLHELNTLIFYNNVLTELPEDLFKDVGNLISLYLNYNQVILPKGIFRYIPKLEVLELGSNNISFLEPGIFRNLTKLRLLNLWGNRLQNLTRSIFSDLQNLEGLDLNNNGLKTLPPDVFTDLIKLKNVNLYNNDFVSLPQSLFRSSSRLETIQINSNRHTLKTLPPAFFANLTHLKHLNLKNNNMSELPEDLLSGCTALELIELQYNHLQELPEKIFNDIQNATMIDLSYNNLGNLPNDLFSSLYKLKTLNMSHNEITKIQGDLFSNSYELQIIKLSHNKIKTIHSEAFKGAIKLHTVDLSYNELSELGNGLIFNTSPLQLATNLEYLNLSHNNFDYFYNDWQISMTKLRLLDLSYNNFTKLMIHDIQQFTSTSLTVDMSHNKIAEVSLYEAERFAAELPILHGVRENYSPKVILQANPLQCDCNAYEIIRYFKQHLEPEIYLLATFEGANLTCAGPEELKDTLVMNLDPREVACKADETECPKNCTCFYRPSNSAMIVDCSRRNLTKIPVAMPTNGTLLSKTNHTELDLKENKIVTFPDKLGPGYSNVTKLYLSYNNLTSINITNFSKDLQVIELDNNNLTRMDIASLKTLEQLEHLEIITLQNNPWICDCQSKEFHSFLRKNFKKVPLLENITCSNGALISKLTINDLCPLTHVLIKAASLVVAVIGLIIGALIGFYYRFQKEIKVWLYAHRYCLWFVTEEELDKDKKYDAFVSYSHQDEKFIIEHLQPVLEKGDPKYSLCLHYRDWLVGDLIPVQIARSVEESRRTIVVLSPHFLESVWGKMEFRTAHCQALREGRARVIMILYGDIGPTDKLDPELRAYLSTNTYVKWGDPWFWQKLRYALPHPVEHSKGGGVQFIPRQSILQNGTEKLINGSDPNSTTTSVTTPPANALIIEPLKMLADSKPI